MEGFGEVGVEGFAALESGKALAGGWDHLAVWALWGTKLPYLTVLNTEGSS